MANKVSKAAKRRAVKSRGITPKKKSTPRAPKKRKIRNV